MQKLYEITIPGLSVAADLPAVRYRLLADFPDVLDVLATTMPATVLIVYRGVAKLDAWLDALSDSVAIRRASLGPSQIGAADRVSSTHNASVDSVTPTGRSSAFGTAVHRGSKRHCH